MRGAELRNGWDLFDDVVAEEHTTSRHERAWVTSVDGDRSRRIDERSRHVVLVNGHLLRIIAHAWRVRQHFKLMHVGAVLGTVLAVDDQVRLDARVVKSRDDLKPAEEVFVHAATTNTLRPY